MKKTSSYSLPKITSFLEREEVRVTQTETANSGFLFLAFLECFSLFLFVLTLMYHFQIHMT